MEPTPIEDVVALCRAIDEIARDTYAELAQRADSPDLDDFWTHMSDEEAAHVRFWTRTEEQGLLHDVPSMFEDTDRIVDELSASLSRSKQILSDAGGEIDTSTAFTLAFRMEFYLLHPAFELLFRILAPLAGEPNPAEQYESHISRFIDMLTSLGSVTPELELLGETIERLWRENKRLAHQATRDSLTNVLNRRGFFSLASQFAHLASRTKSATGVMMIDIDRFKAVNDIHGHAFGDRALRHTAEILTSRLRQTDIIGRYGGEEFVVLATPVECGTTKMVAEQVRAAVEAASSERIPTTVSIGVAEAVLDADVQKHFFALVRRADDALYEAKRQGRNRVVELDFEAPGDA